MSQDFWLGVNDLVQLIKRKSQEKQFRKSVTQLNYLIAQI
jgi:hypothetical protein